MSALDAAVTLAKASGWSLTNLEIQKLLYLAQLEYMGEHGGDTLFSDDFQAWKLGPVIPKVYQRARDYGSAPVRNFFHLGEMPEGSRKDSLLMTYGALKNASAWDLVAITHWEDGAWYKNFQPGAKSVVIPKSDILDEYARRIALQ